MKLENQIIRIEDIYVPVKRQKTLNLETVGEIANSMLEVGQLAPILIRRDREKERYILVEGLHRLEACKAVGDETILAFLVQARKH